MFTPTYRYAVQASKQKKNSNDAVDKVKEGAKEAWNDVINVVQAWFPAKLLDKMRFGNMSEQDVREALKLIKERMVEERIQNQDQLDSVASKIQDMLNSNSVIMSNLGKKSWSKSRKQLSDINRRTAEIDSNLEEFNKIDPDKIKTKQDLANKITSINFKEDRI